MKFSYNWINEYFDGNLPPAEEVATKVGLHSFELEEIEELDNGDFLIDWDILPNRSSDCLSYSGIVREIGAVLGVESKDPLYRMEGVVFDEELKTSDFVSLKVEDDNLVKRAAKRMAVEVKVGPSPEWLVERLAAMGQKSINNVVDITNYVMWVTGQPVHAFDYDKLKGADKDSVKIDIKSAKKGDKITDLAGDEHELDDSILIITDGNGPMDIAGVKGGNSTGVDENTKRVLMSACNFEYENIRNTANKLKIQTDASKRFENEVPLFKVKRAMLQFGYLMQELAGAKVSEEIVMTNPEDNPRDSIKVGIDKVNSVLGTELSKEEILSILARLWITKKDEGEDWIEVVRPEDRLDINIPEDVIEEVGRLYGYENLEEKAPDEGFTAPVDNEIKKSIYSVSDTLVELGFYEVYNRTLTASGNVELANPLTSEAGFLRENLLGSLLKRAEKNLQHSEEPRVFEIGKIFTGETSGTVDEHYSFAGVIGKRKIKEKQKADIFYTTKGVLESVFEKLGVKNVEWKDAEGDVVSILEVGGQKLGEVGVNYWEMDFEKLVSGISKDVEYKKSSKYPKIERDVAFFVGEDVKVSEVEKMISDVLPEQAIDLKLFDVYEDSENNRKSFGFRVTFQSETETLSDEFANGAMEKVYDMLKKKGFEIR